MKDGIFNESPVVSYGDLEGKENNLPIPGDEYQTDFPIIESVSGESSLIHIDNEQVPSQETRDLDAYEILLRMQGGGASSSRVFSGEKMQWLREHPPGTEDFRLLVQEGLQRKPEMLLCEGIIHDLQGIITQEEMKAVINQIYQRTIRTFFREFSHIGELLSDDEKRKYVAAAIRINPDIVFSCFGDEAIHELYEDEEKRKILLDAASGMKGIYVSAELLNGYYAKGILHEDEVQDIIISTIRGKDGSNNLDFIEGLDALEWCRNGGYDSRVKLAFQDSMTQNGGLNLFRIKGIPEHFLSLEDKAEILRRRLSQNPSEFQYYGDYAKKYFSNEEYGEVVNGFYEMVLENPRDRYIFDSWDVSDPALRPEVRKKLFDLMIERGGSENVFVHFDTYMQLSSGDDSSEYVHDLLRRIPAEIALRFSGSWRRFVPDDTYELFEQELSKRTEEEFLEQFSSSDDFSKLLPLFWDKKVMQRFSVSELERLQDRALLAADAYYFSERDIKCLKDCDGEEYVKSFFERVCSVSPRSFLNSLGKISYLYTSGEIQWRISGMLDRSSDASDIFSNLDKFIFIISPQEARTLLISFQPRYSALLLRYLETWKAVFLEREILTFLESLVRDNPYAAYSDIKKLQDYFPEIFSKEQCLGFIRQDKEEGLLPKTLSDLGEKFEIESNEGRQEILINKGTLVYQKIGYVHSLGVGKKLQKMVSSVGVSKESESYAIDAFLALGKLLKDDASLTQAALESVFTTEGLDELLMMHLQRVLSFHGEDKEMLVHLIKEALGSIAPISFYTAQYTQSPHHVEVLRDIVSSIAHEKFDEYKFGMGDNGAFEEMKIKKLVPDGMTYQQYGFWRTEEITSSNENIEANAEEIALSISQKLRQNRVHFGVPDELEFNEEALQALKGSLNEIGTSISQIEREIGILQRKKQTGEMLNDDEQQRFSTLEVERGDARIDRDKLQYYLNCIRLSLVSAEEVSAKSFKKAGHMTEKISSVLNALRFHCDSTGRGVLQGIEASLAELGSLREGSQDVFCSDTSDPKVTLEIGQNPVPSCQNYAEGSYNKCLLGYFDPASKIVLLKNEKGTFIARSIFRVLSLSDGFPALHLERVYSTSASKLVRHVMLEHALRKAEKMGIPLYVSDTEDFEIIHGYAIGAENAALMSRASRAPLSYVDSAGGEQSLGKYTIKNAVSIVRNNLDKSLS
jgi:hypothetical protein